MAHAQRGPPVRDAVTGAEHVLGDPGGRGVDDSAQARVLGVEQRAGELTVKVVGGFEWGETPVGQSH